MRKAIIALVLFAVADPAAFAQDAYKRGTFGVQNTHNRGCGLGQMGNRQRVTDHTRGQLP